MTPERKERLEAVLDRRQPDLTVVLENVFDPHNISAIMRTCDAVGIQDLYVLTTRVPKHHKWGFKSSSSAYQWLTVHQFTDFNACINALAGKYQQILTTHLGSNAVGLYDIDFSISTALVFGNEQEGVTPEFRERAHGNFVIPQEGIIKSLNVSVACAVTLYEAARQKRAAGHFDSRKLSDERYDELWKEWTDLRRKRKFTDTL